METSIIVALITGVCAVVGSVWGQWLIASANKKKADAERAVKEAVLEQRLDAIEAKLDEHNGYARRFEEVAVAIAELRTELKLKA